MNLHYIHSILYVVLLSCKILAARYIPEARWAQATLVIDDVLFVYGGKTDPFNSYSYTSAPSNNELLSLSLSQPFQAANPQWQLLSNSSNPPTFQGPALAWHTLSSLNTSSALIFGGEPGPNSRPPISDSAVLLDLSSLSRPAWYAQATSWGGQPIRRIYHTSATAPSGVVYIIGGQKADGSGIGFSDHYAFNPQTLTFSPLSSENAPPEIYGHASLMFVDGRLIVFGGASKNSLLPLSTIWVLDTSKDVPHWSQMQVSTDYLPSSRRGFAATVIGQGRILIQGGSDVNLQNNLDDGWILDTSTSPAVWMPVDRLSYIGPRRDHYAVYSNDFVVFGFGYLDSGPAPADLQIFYLSDNTFVSSYTPPVSIASTIQTLSSERHIPAVPTETTTNHQKSLVPSSTTAVVYPTATLDTPRDDEHKRDYTAAIIVGVILGVLGAIAIVVVIVMNSRRQQRRRSEDLITGDEDNGSLHANSTIPAVTMYSGSCALSTERWGNGLMGAAFEIGRTLSAMAKSRGVRDTYQRRDMLADEDIPEFGQWPGARRGSGIGKSSLSLKSFLGIWSRSREPTTSSHGSSSRLREKSNSSSDGVSLMYDQEPEPHGGRKTNLLSASDYVDPFADPIDEKGNTYDTHDHDLANAALQARRELSTIRIVPPTSTNGHSLSPLSEHTSNSGFSSNDLLSSVDYGETPTEADTSLNTLQLTVEPSPSIEVSKTPISFPSTLIPASVPLVTVRRSDSWWSRFYRTSFLDRRSTPRSSTKSEFLDPNFPPSLDPITESIPQTPVAEFSAKQQGSDKLPVYKNKLYKADPGNSMISLRTADTERIEQMASAMDVAQRWHAHSLRTFQSISSGLSVHTRRIGQENDSLQVQFDTVPFAESPRVTDPSDALIHCTSPSVPDAPLLLEQRPLTEQSWPPTPPTPHNEVSGTSETGPPTSSRYGNISLTSNPSVAARVRMFEQKSTQHEEQPLPVNTRRYEERLSKKNWDYGFVPRQNLFIANPDHRNSYSTDS